ncbi:hypothetical protein DC498_14120 [Terrimonas sp.]|nr:hypothetical protein DC498_14120 [Terrimonas sp.]
MSGFAEGEIEKMRSIFFQKTKSSGVPVTQPAGCGGKKRFVKFNYAETAAWFLKNLIQNPCSNLITKA